MFEVRDDSRILTFNGKLLGESSSWRVGSTRWIEFSLYKTENGSYILSRVGVSLVYHGAACPLVKRYGLTEIPVADIHKDALVCEDCQPATSAGLVFPEKNRYWAQVSDDPGAVLDALYKYDQGGARYLTKVAERLLKTSSITDGGIKRVYSIELIP